MPIESVKIKISKIGLRHVLSWPKLGLEPKFHDPGTYGGFGKRGQTHRQTHRQDSCFISIDLGGTSFSGNCLMHMLLSSRLLWF